MSELMVAAAGSTWLDEDSRRVESTYEGNSGIVIIQNTGIV